jgi:hypothetical protein
LLLAPLLGRQLVRLVQVASSAREREPPPYLTSTTRHQCRSSRKTAYGGGASSERTGMECGEKVDGALCVDTCRRAGSVRRVLGGRGRCLPGFVYAP